MAVVFLPVISGIASALSIPAIAAFFANLAANVLAWLATRVTRATAINLTVLVMVIGLAAAVAASLYALLGALSYVTPEYVSQGFSFFLPSNAIPCTSAIISAKFIRWVWEWQFYSIIKMSTV